MSTFVSASRSGGRGSPSRGRFATRRRLVFVLSAVLAAFLPPLVVQLVGLRRMEATFAKMREHEEQVVLALRLEDAARELHGHAVRAVAGDAREVKSYEQAWGRLVELTAALAARLDEPGTEAPLRRIREASAELDDAFRRRIEPAARRGAPAAPVALEEGYSLVSVIDRSGDEIIGGLQASSTEYREALAALEDRALRWTAALLVLAPLFVAGATLYLSRSVALPLARVSEGASAIAAGRLDARIDIDTPDEFGALAAELNAMTASLRQHQRRLAESEKLAGVGRLAAGVAHELNNPLQVMLGYRSLNRDVPDERLAAQLAAVEAETLRCRDIVEDLLELARPAEAAIPVDLRALCADASHRLRTATIPGTPALSMEGGAIALADPLKVGQVVFNLLKNAAEAAGPTGDVSVRIRATCDRAEIVVRDSGPGIAPHARARIFEPFFTTKPKGTGLGLAVSRAIARAHGGDIVAGNVEAGGAEFTLTLPIAPEARG